MTATALARAKAKRARRPIYASIEPVAVLETGEERLGILAQHAIDRRLMLERGYKRGDMVRLEIKKPRNVKFHRLVHAIGHLLVDNVEEFRAMDAHSAVKKVQGKAGVCCETQLVDMGTLTLGDLKVDIGEREVSVPRSIAFDEMDATEFEELFKGLTDYIDQNYASVMTEGVRAEYLLMVEGNP